MPFGALQRLLPAFVSHVMLMFMQGRQESLHDQQLDQPQMLQTANAVGLSLMQYPANVQAVATVTGVVLYAQGVWGLW